LNQSNLHIDYLNFTHQHSGEDNPFRVLSRAAATVAEFSNGLDIGEIEQKGLHGYTWSFKVTVRETGETAGFVAAGGTNFGSVLYSFSGKGCKHISASRIYALLKRVKGGRITRIDIAYDDLEGTRTPFDVREAYRQGQFKNRGQNPKCDQAGPWESPEHWGDGLTFYVGKRETGKMLRAYEKGKQLGDPHSPWVRFEVEISRKKRDIPLTCLKDLVGTFIGAYKWLEWAAEEQGAGIGLIAQEEQRITVNHLVKHAKRSYGKLFGTLLQIGVTTEHLVSIIRSVGTPRRLDRRYLFKEFVTGANSEGYDDHVPYVTEHGELLNPV